MAIGLGGVVLLGLAAYKLFGLATADLSGFVIVLAVLAAWLGLWLLIRGRVTKRPPEG